MMMMYDVSCLMSHVSLTTTAHIIHQDGNTQQTAHFQQLYSSSFEIHKCETKNQNQRSPNVVLRQDSMSEIKQAIIEPVGRLPTTRFYSLIFFLILHLLIVVTQVWAVFDYDRVASYKLQEPRVLADEGVVQSNRAIGIGSALVVLPLNLLAIYGNLCRKGAAWNTHATCALLGLSTYWPVVFLASRYTYPSGEVRCVSLQGEDLGICLFMIVGSIYLLVTMTASSSIDESNLGSILNRNDKKE